MLSHHSTNKFINKIECTIILDPKNKIHSNSQIELYTPTFAHKFAFRLGGMIENFTVKYFRDFSRNIVGWKIHLNIPSSREINLDNDKSQLESALQESANHVFGQEIAQSTITGISSMENVNPSAIFHGKAGERLYTYDALSRLESMQVSYLDEHNKPYAAKPAETKIEYDGFEQICAIQYTYKQYKPSLLEAMELEDAIKLYTDMNPQHFPILKSIMDGNFNQALRRACAAGIYCVAEMLFDFARKYPSNFDVNQPSLNGKTALDYALESKVEKLILLLRNHRALTHNEIVSTYHDYDRFKILQLNTNSRDPGYSPAPMSHISMSHNIYTHPRLDHDAIGYIASLIPERVKPNCSLDEVFANLPTIQTNPETHAFIEKMKSDLKQRLEEGLRKAKTKQEQPTSSTNFGMFNPSSRASLNQDQVSTKRYTPSGL